MADDGFYMISAAAVLRLTAWADWAVADVQYVERASSGPDLAGTRPGAGP